MKKIKRPKLIKAHFPPPTKPTVPPKLVCADFVLNFNTPDKLIVLRVPNSDVPKFAELLFKMFQDAGIMCAKEEKLR